MAKKPTKEEIIDRILKSGVDARTNDEYIDARTPMLFYCSKGHEWPAKLGNITHNHQGCPYCSGRYPIVGETDLWTTNKIIAGSLLHPEDGYRFTQFSSKKVDFVCPNCGEILNRAISNVSQKGLSCHICGDGISYPNKFMASVLKQLNIDYIPEFQIDDANYRYDFYIPVYNLVIEMHGRQHYEDWNRKGISCEDVQLNDRLKFIFAVEHGVDKYVCIDARNSDINYISTGIKKSKLNDLFNLQDVDWKKCGYYASGSLVHSAASLWNSGYSASEIAEELKVNISTIYNWLKKGTELNLCNWIKSKGFLYDKRQTILVNTKELFDSVADAGRKYNISPQNISANCHKRRAYVGIHPITKEPMVWRFFDEYDANEIIDFKAIINPHINYLTVQN
jgi:predicted DNA-binding protein YlxM (UPF0122 family)